MAHIGQVNEFTEKIGRDFPVDLLIGSDHSVNRLFQRHIRAGDALITASWPAEWANISDEVY